MTASPTKLYIAHCCDRHIDDVICVFDAPEKAVQYCKDFIKDNARHPDSIEESDIDGWLYHATYSSDGDWVRAFEVTLNSEDQP